MKNTFSLKLALPLVAALVIGSCKVQFAPKYDAQIYSGIVQINEMGQAYFISAQEGLEPADYADYQATYDKIIGQIEAITILMDIRPVPDSKTLDRLNKTLAKFGKKIPVSGGPVKADFSNALASKIALDSVKSQIMLLKSDHKNNTVPLNKTYMAVEAKAFTIYMKQALFFESFLKREE
jgi:hypothetical protein